jgi:hypothetical protein
MEQQKGTPLQIAATIIRRGEKKHLPGVPGGPNVPVIGGIPDRKTQNIPLMDILTSLNKKTPRSTK